jgi:DNA-binding winged helix-turn-helix (wHTH) protein/Tol biopolymer transport system component
VTIAAHSTQIWRFGVFEADARTGELRRVGNPIRLREQSFRILLLLLEHAGEVVTREELRKALWPADTFVDFDHSLNAAVMKLREALGDTAENPVYIETIPRRGYRFIAPLAPVAHAERETGVRSPEVRASSRIWLSLSLILALAGAAGVWFARRPLPPPRITDYVQLSHDPRFKEVAVADANRLYVNLWVAPEAVLQMPLNGGELVPIPIQLPGEDRPIPGLSGGDFPNAYGLSPDGSTFLCSGPTYSLWSVTITGDPIRHLATAEGAAWSPDGRSIVYTWRGDIFVTRSDGSDTRMIVSSQSFPNPGQSNIGVTWSPDGSRIRFTRDHDLWEVSSSGSNLHRMLAGWQPGSWKLHGRWTPDGSFFIFLAGDTSAIPPFTAGNQLWALDERRTWFGSAIHQPIQLTSGPTHWGRPVPSRDGTRIYARGVVPNGELVRYDQRAKQWAPFLGGRSAEFLTFSPDRKSIAFVRFPEGVLYRANVDGTGLLKLTEPPLAIRNAQWSPDGAQILINAQMANESAKSYLLSAQGGAPKRVMPDDQGSEGDPQWSPDGKRIVYNTASNAWEPSGRIGINIFDLATGKSTSLPGSGEDFSPRWSPDGRHIAALTVSTRKLKVFDLNTSKWTTVFDGVANFPTWSSDGRFIYFIRDGGVDIARVPVSGGPPESVASLKGVPATGSWQGWFGLDPEDVPLYLRDKGTDEVYALSLARE